MAAHSEKIIDISEASAITEKGKGCFIRKPQWSLFNYLFKYTCHDLSSRAAAAGLLLRMLVA